MAKAIIGKLTILLALANRKFKSLFAMRRLHAPAGDCLSRGAIRAALALSSNPLPRQSGASTGSTGCPRARVSGRAVGGIAQKAAQDSDEPVGLRAGLQEGVTLGGRKIQAFAL